VLTRGSKFDSSESQVFSFLGFFTNINRGGCLMLSATVNRKLSRLSHDYP
jgi:hypothetical protein